MLRTARPRAAPEIFGAQLGDELFFKDHADRDYRIREIAAGESAGEGSAGSVSATAEIAELRRVEALISRESERLGRLQNRVMLSHPGNLIVTGVLPRGTWAVLPAGWQTATELGVTPRFGVPPRDVKGAVWVSEEVAERICHDEGSCSEPRPDTGAVGVIYGGERGG